MRKIIVFGLMGVAAVWGVISWILSHGFLDFFSLVFIILSFIVISWFAASVLRGEAHG